jgi:hypothetical protein
VTNFHATRINPDPILAAFSLELHIPASAKKSPSRINGRGASRFRPSAYCDVLKANASRF